MAVLELRYSASTLERIDDLLPDPAMAAARSIVAEVGTANSDGLLAFARRSRLNAYTAAARLVELARRPAIPGPA